MIRNNVPHIFFLALLFLISNISYTYADWQPAKAIKSGNEGNFKPYGVDQEVKDE